VLLGQPLSVLAASGENLLCLLECCLIDQWLVLAAVELVVPADHAEVGGVCEDHLAKTAVLAESAQVGCCPSSARYNWDIRLQYAARYASDR